jgi:hypothetical protein
VGFTSSEIVAVLSGASFAAGLNVYATVATLGLLSRVGLLSLPSPLHLLDNWWVIVAAAALFLIEFIADKIPALDLIWNALHTFVRVPVAALLAYGATTQFSPGVQAAAAGIGGVVALAAHGGKMAVRTAITPSPEPFSNIALSLGEDVLAVGLTWFATVHPYVAAAVVAVLLLLVVLTIRLVYRALVRLFRGARRQIRAQHPQASKV